MTRQLQSAFTLALGLLVLPTLSLAQYGPPPPSSPTSNTNPFPGTPLPTSSPNSSPNNASAAGLAKFHKLNHILVAHAVVGTLAFLLFVPGAVLVGRWLRRVRGWVWLHQGLNGLGSCMVVAAFGLGYYHVKEEGVVGHWTGAHPRMGLALLVLILRQSFLGLAAHHTPLPRSASPPILGPHHPHPTLSRSKSPLRPLHILTGLITVGLGLAQLQTGISLYDADTKFNGMSRYSHAVLWSVAGVAIAAYVGGWVWEVVAVRRGSRQASVGSGVDVKP